MEDKSKNKKLNAFAGRRVGGEGKYIDHHNETLRREKAEETTTRIKQFRAQNKTLAWANRAIEFCKYEEEVNKDIVDICDALKQLPEIRSEAQSIIDEENARTEQRKKDIEIAARAQEIKDAERKRQLELLKIEQDLKTQAEEEQYIANVEQIINSLAKGVRNRAWVDSVEETVAIAAGLPPAAYNKIKNRHLLNEYRSEANLVEQAIMVDDEVVDLSMSRTKNKAWADRVFSLEAKLDGPYEKYLTKKDDYYDLLTLAGRVFYAPELAVIEGFLKRAERGEIRECMEDQARVSKTIDRLREKIYVDEYIDNFEMRWVDAQDAIARQRERDRIAEELRKKKEKETEAERRRIEKAEATSDRIKDFMAMPRTLEWARSAAGFCKAEERAGKDIVDLCQELSLLPQIKADAQKIIDDENQRIIDDNAKKAAIARARKLAAEEKAKRQKMAKLITAGVALVVIIASVIVGIFTNGIASSIVFGAGCSLGVFILWVVLNCGVLNEDNRHFVYVSLMLIQMIMAAVSFFMDHSGVLSLCIVGFAFITMGANIVLWGDGFEFEDYMYVGASLGSVILAAALYAVIGGYWGACIAAVLPIPVGFLIGYNNDCESNDFLSIINVLCMIAGCVAMFFNWQLYILGIGVVIGHLITACFNTNQYWDEWIPYAGGIVGGLCAFIALMIHIL